jgi:HSP20 family protein
MLRLSDDPFRHFTEQMSQMMDEMSKRDFYPFSKHEGFEPGVNLYETRTAYLLCVDLAGMKPDKIDVSVAGSKLTIRGDRPAPRPKETLGDFSIHLMEIPSGSFKRNVAIPEDVDVDADGVSAAYREGYLWLTLPRLSGSEGK